MLLPLTCLKRDFLKVLQSLRGYIDTILPKSLGHIARVAYRQACPEAVVRGLGDGIGPLKSTFIIFLFIPYPLSVRGLTFQKDGVKQQTIDSLDT